VTLPQSRRTTTKFVERPPNFSHKDNPIATEEQRLALLKTAANGKAIVIALNERSLSAAQRILRSWLSTRGYRFRYRLNMDRLSITCWVEKKTSP
jgi:hypothetical protein